MQTSTDAAGLTAQTALALLDAHPASIVVVDSGGQVHWANPAAAKRCGSDLPGRRLAEALALDAADRQRLAPALALADGESVDLPSVRLRLRIRPLPDGRRTVALFVLEELAQARQESRRLAELLELAQDFGRLGVWERDVHTLQGRWDRHVHRFWGLPEDAETPDFDAATQSIVEGDRQALAQAFRDSVARSGTYAQRFRVRQPDGTLRQLHSQWVVKDGDDGHPQRVLGIMVDDTEAWQLSRAHGELESQLALAVELVGIGIWRHDLASGRLQFNRQCWDVLDLEPQPQDLSIDDVRALIHPLDLARVRASAAQALDSGRPTEIEARHRLRNGGWRTVLTRRVVERDAGGQPVAFIGVALDVSERVEAARRAQDLGRHFEMATRTAGIGCWSLEQGAERAVWSAPMRTLHGLADAEPVPSLADWLQHFVHRQDRAQVQQRLRDWVRRGGSDNLEFRIVRRNGEVRDVLTHARVEQQDGLPTLFGVVIDVTERRNAGLALRQAAERAALAARGAGLGTWEYDLRSGRNFWDEQMWRLRGRAPRDGAPSHEEWMSFVHPDDVEAADRRVALMMNGEESVNYEFRVVWPDGSVRWLASRSAPLRDEHGVVVRRIGVNWDITDARNAEVARRERELALRESRAKSQFLARMSHELRTPLNAVLGFTQLLIGDEPAQDDARARRLAHIRSAGEHLLSLIDDVLDLSSLEGGEVRIAVEPVPLAALVAQTLPLLEPLREQHGVLLRTGELSALPLADPVRLRQVLLNLLSNAIKYNRPGGRVTLEALQRGSSVVIRIADTGRGMNDEQLRHLFEPFNRLGIESEGIEGTGIGLAIVKALVERMGGSVHVDSTPGVGSRFEVRLNDAAQQAPPQAAGEAPAAPAAPAAKAVADAATQRPPTLLYIEDNPVNAMIVSELVGRRPDLVLHIAADGLDGLQQAFALRPDLVLLDMQLPDIDGHEVLRRLRAEPDTAAIPVIALSANAMPQDIERALRDGVADYWTKPLDFRAFMASLDALFGPAAA